MMINPAPPPGACFLISHQLIPHRRVLGQTGVVTGGQDAVFQGDVSNREWGKQRRESLRHMDEPCCYSVFSASSTRFLKSSTACSLHQRRYASTRMWPCSKPRERSAR